MKNVEKPVTRICWVWSSIRFGRTSRSVQRREKKCVSITQKEMPAPIAVAKPAPKMPISQANTKNQSPKTLKIPPASTPAVARAGLPSLRRNAASIWLNRKNGTVNLMGSR